MKIACSTSVGCRSSLEETLQSIQKYGFNHVDLLMINNWVHVNTEELVTHWNQSLLEIEKLFTRYEVTPTVINSGVSSQLHHRSNEINSKRTEETKAVAQFMKHYGVKIAAIQPRNQDPTRHWKEVINDCVLTLKEQKEIGDSEGVIFALELHVGSPFETMDQAFYLLDKIPDMPLIYDPSHFVMQGIDIHDTAWLMDNAVHLHLRDSAKGQLQTKVGEGEVDFEWIFKELKKRGYHGDASIEYLQSDEFDVLVEAIKLRELIEGCW